MRQGKVKVKTNARYVNPCDPGHATSVTAAKMKGNMGGFVNEENLCGEFLLFICLTTRFYSVRVTAVWRVSTRFTLTR